MQSLEGNVEFRAFPRTKEKIYSCNKRTISKIAWNQTGSKLVSLEGEVRIWPFASNDLQKSFTLCTPRFSPTLCSFSGENHLAFAGGSELAMMDIRQQQQIVQRKTGKDINFLAWRPNGREIAVGVGGEQVLVLDVRKAEGPETVIKSMGTVNAGLWDLSGAVFILAGEDSSLGQVQLFAAQNLSAPEFKFNVCPNAINSLALDGANEWLAVGGNDAIVQVYELADMLPVKSLADSDGAARGLSFSRDSMFLASWSQSDSVVDIYNLEAEMLGERMKMQGRVGNAAWHPQKHLLAVCQTEERKEEGALVIYQP